jgi:hypothetical protein
MVATMKGRKGMNKYRIAIKLKSTKGWKYLERFGDDMEETLKAAKVSAKETFGNDWTGGIAICGDQSGTGIYAF